MSSKDILSQHHSFFTLLFPFYIEDNQKLDYLLREENDNSDKILVLWDNFINNSSRHLDYIEKIFEVEIQDNIVKKKKDSKKEPENKWFNMAMPYKLKPLEKSSKILFDQNIFLNYFQPKQDFEKLNKEIGKYKNILPKKIIDLYEDVINFSYIDDYSNLNKTYINNLYSRCNACEEALKFFVKDQCINKDKDKDFKSDYTKMIQIISKKTKALKTYSNFVEFFFYNGEFIKDIYLINFHSGIIFLGLKFKLGYIEGKYENYFDAIRTLRDYFKHINILEFLYFLIYRNYTLKSEKSDNKCKNRLEIEGFDKCKVLDTDSYSYRFSILSEIELKYNEKKCKEKSLSFDDFVTDTQRISNWIINRNSVKDNKREPVKESYSLFLDNFITCSEDGLSSLTILNKNNKNIYSGLGKTKEKIFIFQNLLFSYLLNLNQIYYLHKVKKDLLRVEFGQKNSFAQLTQLTNNLNTFKTYYHFDKVSQIYYLQQLFDYISNQLKIKRFYEEIEKTMVPLSNQLTQKTNRKIDTVVKNFSIITIANAFISLFDNLLEEEIIKSFDCTINDIEHVLFLIRLALVVAFIVCYKRNISTRN